MKILIDARLYGIYHRGIGRYLMELINGLTEDNYNQYILLIEPSAEKFLPKLPTNFSVQAAPYRAYTLAEQFYLPRLIKKIKPDLVHWPHFNAPYFCPAPFVITIHDLILHQAPTERASSLPGIVYWTKIIIYHRLIKRLVNRAKYVITVSQTVANDIKQYYPASVNKIITVYLAPSKLPTGRKAKPIRPYFLTVGASYPHKNLEKTIMAVALARQQLGEMDLYIVGRDDYFTSKLKTFVKTNGYDSWIKFFHQVTDQDLANLYVNCQAYLFLSLQEGFGLGPLEAGMNNALVIASDIPVLKEVLGLGAIFVNPNDLFSIKQGIAISFDNETRTRTLNNAKETQSKYSWKKTIDETVKIYAAAIVK